LFDFRGETVVITGGTRGIGRAVARRFLEAGARVVVTHAADDTAAEGFRSTLGPLGKALEIRKFDVARFPDVEAFYGEFDALCENFTVLVNNCGIRKDAVLAMMSPEDWQRVLDVNLTGAFYMSKQAVRRFMAHRYGRIVTITSPASRFGFEGQANYAASKAGQIAMSRSLSKEVASRGITVNCVSPGFIDTDFLKDLPEKLRRDYLESIPLKRFGAADEVAFCVLFLACREAGYITGSVLSVDGGLWCERQDRRYPRTPSPPPSLPLCGRSPREG
jgi:3-oxoacyl-[acyl-carrier protein] reductase